jgi:DNA-binding transcriptional regulator LsrR (DeoR family)
MGPDELAKVTHVARRHYIDGVSQVAIATEMDVSRFKIARMLEKAHDLGIVTITIAEPKLVDAELSLAVRERFGLLHALAVRTASDEPEAIQDALGHSAAELLEEIVQEGDLLGFTAGRTLDAVTRHLQRLPNCDVVALGGVAGSVREHGVEIVRRVARVSSGESYPIFAPLFVESPATARELRAEPLLADVFARFPHVTKGIVAVGSWSPPDSQLFDAAEKAQLADGLVRRGVIGEVSATLFDADGRIVDDIDERSIAITAEQLRRIPEVIAVAGGAKKTTAVLAALRSGLVRSLVTDAALAQRLLDLTDGDVALRPATDRSAHAT